MLETSASTRYGTSAEEYSETKITEKSVLLSMYCSPEMLHEKDRTRDCEKVAWLRPTVEELISIGELEHNWDSYGASRIPKSRIHAVIDLLDRIMSDSTPPPAVVPTARGTIQLEWHRNGVDLEIDVLGALSCDVYFENTNADSEVEYSVRSDYTRLMKHVNLIR